MNIDAYIAEIREAKCLH